MVGMPRLTHALPDWIDRPGSPLRGLVALMYPQGSMAIGATIARASDREEYDIDVIVAPGRLQST